jgi:hypothetical protein
MRRGCRGDAWSQLSAIIVFAGEREIRAACILCELKFFGVIRNASAMQRFEVNVRFDCPICRIPASASVEVPEPEWDAAEGFGDLNSEGETAVQCPRCATWFEAYVVNSAGHCDVTLTDHKDTAVHAGIASYSYPDEDELADYPVADNPLEVFNESHRQIEELLQSHGGEDGHHIINRMVFAQQISALEAYLGDTLINVVSNNKSAMARLLGLDKELAKERFSLHEVASSPNLVPTKVRQYLKSILYHNLKKVNFLYKAALDIDLLDPAVDNSKIFRAIEYRHDCVHRNGFDGDGNKLDVFTKSYVREVSGLIRALIQRIESALPF